MMIPRTLILLPLLVACILTAMRFYWLRASGRGTFNRILIAAVLPLVVFVVYVTLTNAGPPAAWMSMLFGIVAVLMFATAVWLWTYVPRHRPRARSAAGR